MLKIYKNKKWVCQLEEGKNAELALVVEIYDEREFEDNPNENYPYSFDVSIVNANPTNKDDIEDAEDETQDAKIESSYMYRGGAPITHDLYSLDRCNKNKLKNLTVDEACVHQQKDIKYGTLAAQGHREFTFLKYRTEETANDIADLLIMEYAAPIFELIGFFLDRPINMIGNTGWEIIREAEQIK